MGSKGKGGKRGRKSRERKGRGGDKKGGEERGRGRVECHGCFGGNRRPCLIT